MLAMAIMLSMATNASALALCPHMNARASCPGAAKELPTPGTSHSCMHSEVSGMDMDGMRTSGMEETGMQPSPDEAVAEAVFSNDAIADISESNAEALTQTAEDCAHCLMHSQNNSAVSFSFPVQTGNSHDLAAPEVAGTIVKVPPPILSIFDPNDHGPPGPGSALHVLNSLFRI